MSKRGRDLLAKVVHGRGAGPGLGQGVPSALAKSLLSQGVAGANWLHGLEGGYSAGGYAAGMESEELHDPLMQEPWIASAVNLHAQSVANVRLVLWDRDPNDQAAQEVTRGPMRELLDHVGPDLTPALLRKTEAEFMDLSGEVFWLLADELGRPVTTSGLYADALVQIPAQIIPVHGAQVHEVVDRYTGRVTAWRVSRGNKGGSGGSGLMGSSSSHEVWPAGSVVQFLELPDHRRPGRGLGRVAQAWGSAAQSYLARRYNQVWLRNFGDPGGVVSIESWLSDGEYDRMRAELTDAWDDPERRGETRLLEGGAKYERNVSKPRDMAFETLVHATREEVAAVMGTPSAVLGDRDMTYATFSGHYRTFLFLRIVPYLDSLADTLNSMLFPRLADRGQRQIRCSFDYSALEQTTRDKSAQATNMHGFVRAGVPVNQAALITGVELERPTPAGDVPLVTKAMVPLDSQVLESKGRAMKALVDAGIDAQAAANESGLGGLKLKEPDPVPAALLPPASAGEDDDEDEPAPEASSEDADEGEVGGQGDESGDEKAAAEVVTRQVQHRATSSSSEQRRWNAWNRKLRAPRRRMTRQLNSTLWAMRKEQVAALEAFANGGGFPTVEPPLAAQRATQPAIPATASSDWDRLLLAYEADQAEQRAILELNPDAMAHDWVGCDGQMRTIQRAWRPRQEEWLRRHPRHARVGLDKLRTAAWQHKAQVSDEELDRLLTVSQAKWTEQLAVAVQEQSLVAYSIGANIGASSMGLDAAILDATDPKVVQFFARKAIEVVEGTQSVLADTLRRNISRALVENPNAIGMIEQQVLEALHEVKAGTTRAFNTHRSRASAIAQTETMGASNGAAFETYVQEHKAGRLTGIRWLTSGRGPEPEGTVRTTHYRIESNGEQVVPGAPFSNGLRFPGDSGGPAAEVVNCQCTLMPVRAE